jgi:DNA repair exonuclease SbcCD nuclease subunit
MKSLYVGDMHVVSTEIDESGLLIEEIKDVASQNGVDEIRFSGDQFNSHDSVSVKVLDFWWKAFSALKKVCDVACLVGNHDQSAPGDRRNVMSVFSHMVRVVAEPQLLEPGVFAAPYLSEEEFKKMAFPAGTHTLFCHQTFDGTQYDNGFYAKDAVPAPDLRTVISGHIHSAQVVGNVTYIGSPRWRNLNDANQEKFLWIFDSDESETRFVTKTAVTSVKPIHHVVYRIGDPLPDFSLRGEIRVDLSGPKSEVRDLAAELRLKGIRVKEFPDPDREIRVRESDRNSLKTFLAAFEPPYGTPKSELESEVVARAGTN